MEFEQALRSWVAEFCQTSGQQPPDEKWQTSHCSSPMGCGWVQVRQPQAVDSTSIRTSTVLIDDTRVRLQLTLPHHDVSGCWRRLRKVSKRLLEDTLEEVARRIRPLRRHVTRDLWEPQVQLHLQHRHFYARDLEGIGLKER